LGVLATPHLCRCRISGTDARRHSPMGCLLAAPRTRKMPPGEVLNRLNRSQHRDWRTVTAVTQNGEVLMKSSILVRALFLYTISAPCVLAQDPAAELQELKAKVQQLQQQIAKIEQSLKAQSARATPPPASVPITSLPTTYIGK